MYDRVHVYTYSIHVHTALQSILHKSLLQPAHLRAINNIESKLKEVESGYEKMIDLKVQLEKTKQACPEFPAFTRMALRRRILKK